MKRLALSLIALAAVSIQPAAQTPSGAQNAGRTGAVVTALTLLDTYCISCHSSTVRAGGVGLAGVPLEAMGNDAETWEKAVRKLRGRQMPPPGSRQPDQIEVDLLVAEIEGALDSAARNHPVAGHVPMQRMTRTEYGIAVKDLLGVETIR